MQFDSILFGLILVNEPHVYNQDVKVFKTKEVDNHLILVRIRFMVCGI